MFKNYFTTAIRNLKKNKAFSFINIFGLAIGLTSFMFIAVFVLNELSYDKYPARAKNIYRVILSVTGNGDIAAYPMVDVAVGEGMKKAFPGIEATTRLAAAQDFVKYDDKQFKEKKLAFADSNFLQLFSIPLLEGDINTALAQPNSIVISKAFAKKYFGNEDALGKSLSVGTNQAVYKVTGLFDEVPENSHFHFDAFLSLSSWHLARRQPERQAHWSGRARDSSCLPRDRQRCRPSRTSLGGQAARLVAAAAPHPALPRLSPQRRRCRSLRGHFAWHLARRGLRPRWRRGRSN